MKQQTLFFVMVCFTISLVTMLPVLAQNNDGIRLEIERFEFRDVAGSRTPDNDIYVILLGTLYNESDQRQCVRARDIRLIMEGEEYRPPNAAMDAIKPTLEPVRDFMGAYSGQCVDANSFDLTFVVFDVPIGASEVSVSFRDEVRPVALEWPGQATATPFPTNTPQNTPFLTPTSNATYTPTATPVQGSVLSEYSTPQTVEYLVTADTANLRGGAGTTYNIVGVVPQGGSLLVYDETPEVNGWLRIYRPNDEDAYIADFLVERAPTRFYPINQEPVLEASGRGSNITEIIELPASAYRVDATVEDNFFILSVIVVNGDCSDGPLLNEGVLNAQSLNVSALYISTGCEVIFETDNVSGNWEFAVRDLLDPEVLIDSMLIIEDGVTIAGTGRTLTMPTLLEGGTWQISAVVEGNAFILIPQVYSGECDDRPIFNELDFDANILEISTVYRSEESGCTIYWDVSNVGNNWELIFEKLR